MTSRQWATVGLFLLALTGCIGPHTNCWNERDGSNGWTGGKLTGYTCCQPMSGGGFLDIPNPTGPPVCRPFVREKQ